MDIELREVSKKFNDISVIENLSIAFRENKVTFIMGQSGIGKSTLIKILLGITIPDSGKITGMKSKKISAVFQEDSLCENLSVYLNLKIVNDKLSEEEAEKYKKDVGLECVLSKRIRDLSGGMKRRVAILRAIIAEFDILIMDEPFKGLDIDTKNRVMDFIIENTKEKTVIIVTHDIKEHEYFSAKREVDIFYMK